MERTLTRPKAPEWATTTLAPIQTALGDRLAVVREVGPLWRHAVWLVALFIVCGVALSVRLDVQQLRRDIDMNGRRLDDATLLNERLHLEIDARRRVVAVEAAAAQHGLGPDVTVVDLRSE